MKLRRHVQHQISAYIDGDLSPAGRRAVEAHLSDCLACAQELERWRSMLRLVSYHAAVTCPIDCAERVLQRIEERARPSTLAAPPAARRRPHRLRPALAVPALAALLAGGLWLNSARSVHRSAGPGSGPVALAARSPAPGSLAWNSGWATQNGRLAAQPVSVPRPHHGSFALEPAVRVHAPDRLQAAFGRSDSLILASDFAEDDR